MAADEARKAKAAKREIMLAKKRAGMAALRAKRKAEALEAQAAILVAVDGVIKAAKERAAVARYKAAVRAIQDGKTAREVAARENEYRVSEAAILKREGGALAPAAFDLTGALTAVRTFIAYSAFGKLVLAALCNQYNRRHWLQQAFADGDWQKVKLCVMRGSELDVLNYELSITKCRFNAHLCRRRIAGLLELAESESAGITRHSLSAGTAY
jgi:hypothetical protein